MLCSLRLAATCALALLLPACDALDAQAEFEDAAFFPPQGIFRTTDGVNAIGGENDPDDWRTAPIYGTRFLVTKRAFPNPASVSSEFVTIEVSVDGINAIPGGLQLVVNPGTPQRRVVATAPEATSTGFYFLSFSPSSIPGVQSGDLVRLVMFDGRGSVVTYGDLLIAS
jgi:hypothetical protein